MNSSRVDGAYDPTYKPIYEPNYQLYDADIRTVLLALGMDVDNNFMITRLEHLDGQSIKKNKSIESNVVNFILNKGGSHWIWMTASFDESNNITVYVEDSMSFNNKEACKVTLEKIFRSLQHLPDNSVFIKAEGTGKQADGWTCGYRAIAGLISNLVKTGQLPSSEKIEEITDFKDNEELRDSVLNILFEASADQIKNKILKSKTNLYNVLAGSNEKLKHNMVNEFSLRLKEIYDTKNKSIKIYNKDLDFSSEIKEVVDCLGEIIATGYSLCDAVMQGYVGSQNVDALVRSGVVQIIETHYGKKEAMMNTFTNNERDPKKSIDSKIIYFCERNNELIINFSNNKNQELFIKAVPRSEFIARDPITGQFIDDNHTIKTNTVDSRNTTATIYCPTYRPKGRSQFSINLGGKETVGLFIKSLGLNQSSEMKLSNGVKRVTLSLSDGRPLFKHYMDGNQEDALYCHEKSPLSESGSYIKLVGKKIIYGTISTTAKPKCELKNK